MRPVIILSWLPLVCTQAYGMTESTPNMENLIVEQIPMTFVPPVPEDTATITAALDEKALLKCPYRDRDIFNDRGAYYRIYYHLADDACDERADLNPGGQPLYTPRGCIQACTDNPKCKRAIWPDGLASDAKGGCCLRPYTEIAGPVPLGTGCKGYNSAHRQ
ncbi:hypothetical protein PENANT_c121G11056 [Penicillium antarcticum]|uniref:Apple domain-containing protein n=1 Tax=Penicillium antarcticum TaxID=416450 RepID=A0A1V6PJN8_9EURO|nr:hypothetical protein PENANT_c121G11056 [Penicillium antarcticum]